MKSKSFITITAWLIFCTGCGIPRHGGVFGVRPLTGGGLVDRSSAFSGDYIRSTSHSDLVGLKGGAATHHHDIAHVHMGKLTNGQPTLMPRGTGTSAASATHTHSYSTQNQQPTLSSDAPNEFDHINFGLFVREGSSAPLPAGVIIGYVGKAVPQGWALLDGSGGNPNVDGMAIRIAPQPEWGQRRTVSAHTHTATHTHDVVVLESDPAAGTNVQVYAPAATGAFPALAAHGHLVTDLTLTDSRVEAVKPEIPQVRVAFLISTRQGAHLPSGAVIAMTDKHVPGGWSGIGEIARPDYAAPNSEGFFLAGQARLGSPAVMNAPTEHSHMMHHSHSGKVGIAVGVADTKATEGMGNPIAPENHTHVLQMISDDPTKPASHLPPYAQLFLIVKR